MMKKTDRRTLCSLPLLLCAIGLFLLACSTVHAQRIPFWQYQDVVTDVAESGQFPVLKADAAGNLHLTYWNQNADRLVYGYRPAGSAVWSFERVDDSKANGYKSAFVVDPTGRLHVAYFENVNGQLQIRYATKQVGGSSWTVEIPDSNNWGEYGPGALFGTGNVQASVDINLQPGLQPVIVWFDARYDGFNQFYGLEMYLAYKDINTNDWNVTSNGNLLLSNNCTMFGETFAGARYGEHCKLAKRADGTFYIITFAKNNGHLMRYRQLNVNFALQRDIIDSTRRVTNIGPSNSQYCLALESITFNGLSTVTDAAGRIHIFYGMDQDYGRAAFFRNYFSLHYLRIETDGTTFFRRMLLPASIPATNNVNYGWTSCVAIGTDTIIATYAEPENNRYRMLVSTDGGNSFGNPILVASTQVPRTMAPLTVHGDSLYCAYYDNTTQSLMFGAYNHKTAAANWPNFSAITRTEQRGTAFDAEVEEAGATDVFHMAYNDPLRRTLTYGTFAQGGNLTETEIASGDSYDYLDIERDPASGNLYIAFANRQLSRLSLASKSSAGAWATETITPLASGDHVDLVIHNNALHAVHYDEANRQLLYTTRPLSGTNWQQTVVDDGQTDFRGEYCRLAFDANNNPMIAYQDRSGGGVRFAAFVQGSWTIDTLPLNPANVYGTGLALVADASGAPHIFFRNETNNTVGYATGSPGAWTVDTTISLPASFGVLGKPLQVSIDQDGILWMAYNVSATTPEVQLLTQHPITRAWTPIDVTANRDAIGESFSFMISDDALYIAGRKNVTNRKGLGLLYAANGRTVLGFEDQDALVPSLSLYPNPTTGPIHLVISPLNPGLSCTVQMLDLQGRLLLEHAQLPGSEGKITLDTSTLAPGLYLCRTLYGPHSLTQKFMVVR